MRAAERSVTQETHRPLLASYDLVAMSTKPLSVVSQARWRRALMAALALQVLALYWPFGVDLPFSMPQSSSWVPTDKLLHVVLFAVPAYCGVRLAQVTARRALAVAVLAGLFLHAGVSEVIQGAFLPRQRDLFDVAADVVGLLVGAAGASRHGRIEQ